MPEAAIIFDFDGVLADSFETLFSLNSAAMRRIGRPLSRKGYRDLFIGNIHHGLKRLIKDDDRRAEFNRFKKKEFARYYSRAVLFPFAKKWAASLSKTRRLAIVSSTRKRFILKLLRKNRAERHFTAVFGSTAHSKEKELTLAASRIGAKGEKILFITDTVGDIKVGKKLGLDTIAVTWGFHGAGLLRKAGPDGIFSDEDALFRRLSAAGS